MKVSIPNKPIRCLAILLALCTSSLGVALCLQPTPTAHGEPRDSTPQRVFRTSTERTEALLQEIAGTLKRIDQRLERLEQTARAMETKNEQPRPSSR